MDDVYGARRRRSPVYRDCALAEVVHPPLSYQCDLFLGTERCRCPMRPVGGQCRGRDFGQSRGAADGTPLPGTSLRDIPRCPQTVEEAPY